MKIKSQLCRAKQKKQEVKQNNWNYECKCIEKVSSRIHGLFVEIEGCFTHQWLKIITMSEQDFANDIQAWADKYGSENAVAHLIDILNDALAFDDRGRVACELWEYEH